MCVAVISVSLPEALLEQADAFLESRGFAGRSDVVRAALRDFLAREAARAPGTGGALRSATLTLLYPHGAERKIGEIRHEFTDIIRSMMHGHVPSPGGGHGGRMGAPDLCVEVFVLEGVGKRIQQFGDTLRAARESRMVNATWTDSAPESGEPHPGHRH